MAKKSELEARLAEVQDLHARGVLTDAEFTARRAAILQDTSHQPSRSRSGGTIVLGLAFIGASFGILLGLLAMAFGGVSNSVDEGSGASLVALGVSAILAAMTAALFAGLYTSGRHRTLMAWGLFGAAIWHLVSISAFGIPGFVFFVLAAIFAWRGRKANA
ncbi:MAG: SHOCT domain-containing protein [Tepidiformaceae bacterium]